MKNSVYKSLTVVLLFLVVIIGASIGRTLIAHAETCVSDQWSGYNATNLYARTERCWSGSSFQDRAYSSQSSIVGTIRSLVTGWETGLNCQYVPYVADSGYVAQYNATAANLWRSYQCQGDQSNPHVYHTSGIHYFLGGSYTRSLYFE